ncbi:unnamed protein product [[Candida] boidinii]|nr:hypothetical protein BVG19_g91 [[Candida] boidinii]OWB49659.1 hypothetical protein B5S27_g1201 [[Candida] boidinii]OWB84031.1 hypothetical protein B5S33_g2668 [[Candida] boidinii]GMF08088.1 unnamed protein product [[Candida] boidinii]
MSQQSTAELLPSCHYEAPDEIKDFAIDPSSVHTTDGKTTGPSDHVLEAGAIDKDKPSQHKDSKIGRLRAYITTLQDDVNVYLTQRMKEADKDKNSENIQQIEQSIERRVLDDGVDEDDDDEEEEGNEK